MIATSPHWCVPKFKTWLEEFLDSRWLYVAALYPALISVPYFFLTQNYASPSRVVYVFGCTGVAGALCAFAFSQRVATVRRRANLYAGWIFGGLAVLYVLVMFYLAYGVRITNGMGIVSDVANFEQVLWATARGRFFYSSFNNGSILSGHFALIYAPLSWLYSGFQNIGIVFATQTFLFAATAAILYRWLRNFTSRFPALLFALSFLVSPAVVSQNFSLYLNHFAPFLWCAAAYAFWRRNLLTFMLYSIFCALIQEDIAFSLLVFGLLAWLEKRSWQWRAFATLFPMLWFGVGLFVIQQNASVTGIALGGNFSEFGQTPEAIGQSMLAKPEIIFAKVFGHPLSKTLWVYELTSPFLFVLPFLSPLVLAAFPDWAVFMFANRAPEQYSVAWYYSLFIVTVLYTALVFVLAKLQTRFAPALQNRFVTLVSILLLCSNLAMLPLVISPDMFKTDDGSRMRAIQNARAQIPDNACVAVTYDIAQPFARRDELSILGLQRDEIILNCQYIVLSARLVAGEVDAPNSLSQRIRTARDFALVSNENGIELYTRR